MTDRAEEAEAECDHYFHHTTASGYCPRCGEAWKARHRKRVPMPPDPAVRGGAAFVDEVPLGPVSDP